MLELRRILCPIDFSEFSVRAYHHALSLATTEFMRVSVDVLRREPYCLQELLHDLTPPP